MRIQMDAIVHEYLLLTLACLQEFAMEARDARDQEIMTMGILENMLSTGTIEHKFDAEENIDVFTSTPRLISNWSKIFPGNVLKVTAVEEDVVYEMSGDRTYFFNRKWLSKRMRKEGARAWELVVNPGRKSMRTTMH